MNELRQKAVTVAIDTGEYDVLTSLLELEELCDTAGADVVASFTQNRESADKATFIGSGKLYEIKDYIEENGADILVFDSELSGSQIRNIEEIVDIRVS